MSLRTEQNAAAAVLFLWLLILVCCVPALYSHGELSYTFAYTEYSVCIFLATHGYDYAAFQICFFLSSFLAPLAAIFCLYLFMLRRLWLSGSGSAEGLRCKRRATRLVVVVVAAFAGCWCPLQVVLLLKSIDAYELSRVNIALQIAAHVLAYTNSCVNPILYAFLSENFRKAFGKVVGCGDGGGRGGRPPCRTDTAATKMSKVSNDVL